MLHTFITLQPPIQYTLNSGIKNYRLAKLLAPLLLLYKLIKFKLNNIIMLGVHCSALYNELWDPKLPANCTAIAPLLLNSSPFLLFYLCVIRNKET